MPEITIEMNNQPDECPCCRADAYVGNLIMKHHTFDGTGKLGTTMKYFVACTYCGLNNFGPGSGGFPTPLDAVKAWNLRLPISIEIGKVMILTDALEKRGVKVTPEWYVHWSDVVNYDTQEAYNDMDDILSGDLPPCPECAELREQLAYPADAEKMIEKLTATVAGLRVECAEKDKVIEAVTDLVKEFAEYNEDSGWHNVAGELRRRLKSILSATTDQKEKT